jgi:hypothetical protein
MRDWEIIDSEAAAPLLAGVRRAIREHGGEPSSRQIDELLDERLTHRGRADERGAVGKHKASVGKHNAGSALLYVRPSVS